MNTEPVKGNDYVQLEASDKDVKDAGDAVTDGEKEDVEGAASEEVTKEVTEEVTEEVVITFGDSPPAEVEVEQSAPAWVKDLRKNYRELQKRNRELEARLTTPTAQPVLPVLGKKPELADFDFDTEEYEAAVLSWSETKHKIAVASQEADIKAKKQQEAWTARLQTYESAKNNLKVDDFYAAEAAVQEIFDITQQGLIIKSADSPAALVHALGTHKKEASKLAVIKDPVDFVKALTKLEMTMKVHKRNKPPAPEQSTVRGNGRVSGAVDSTLERLRAEAARTGDTSKVVSYKRKLRQSRN